MEKKACVLWIRKREALVCIVWTTLLTTSVLTSALTVNGSPSSEGDLFIVHVEPLQVVWNAKVLIANKSSAICVSVRSTFTTRVWVKFSVTYDFETREYLEDGPGVTGVPIDPEFNLVYLPGGPALSGLPEPWTSSPQVLKWTKLGYDDKIQVMLDPFDEVEETDEDNNRYTSEAYPVVESKELRVLFVPVTFPLGGEWSIATQPLEEQHSFMLATYPLADDKLIFNQRTPWRCEQNIPTDMEPDESEEWLYENVAVPLSTEAQILGYDRVVIALRYEDWVNEFGLRGSGTAIGMLREPENQIPVAVRYSIDDAYVHEGFFGPGFHFSKLVAHEIGHTYYLWHPHDLGPECFLATIYNPMPWGSTSRPDPWGMPKQYWQQANTHMSYRERPWWIDNGRYDTDPKRWLPPGYYDFPGDPSTGWPPPQEGAHLAVGTWQWNLLEQLTIQPLIPVVLTRGFIRRDGRVSLDFPWYRGLGIPNILPRPLGAFASQQKNQGNYSMVLLNDDRQVLSTMSFNVSFRYNYHFDMTDLLEVAETDTMPFLFNVPYVNGTRFIQIQNATDHVLAERTITSNSPTVEVAFPNGDESLNIGVRLPITWEAFDLDGDKLTYLVAYSQDGGETWIPIANNLNETHYVWNTSKLTPGDKYLIKVIATDGVNTGEDASDNTFTLTLVQAAVDIEPDNLNLETKGKSITAYIELPEGYNVNDIDVSSIMLNETVSAKTLPTAIGDHDSDAIPDLAVKFDRTEVTSYILANVNMTELIEERFMTIALTISGKLNDETPFQGSDKITIILNTKIQSSSNLKTNIFSLFLSVHG